MLLRFCFWLLPLEITSWILFMCLLCFHVLFLLTSLVCFKFSITLAFTLLLVLSSYPRHGLHWLVGSIHSRMPDHNSLDPIIVWTHLDGRSQERENWTGIKRARPKQCANEVTGLWWPPQPPIPPPTYEKSSLRNYDFKPPPYDINSVFHSPETLLSIISKVPSKGMIW